MPRHRRVFVGLVIAFLLDDGLVATASSQGYSFDKLLLMYLVILSAGGLGIFFGDRMWPNKHLND